MGLWAENSSFIKVKTWSQSLGGEVDNTEAGAVFFDPPHVLYKETVPGQHGPRHRLDL